LLVALLGSVLCLGIGAFAKDLFANSVCTIGQFLGAANCPQAEPSPQTPGDPGGGGSPSSPLAPVCADPSAAPTPSPTEPSPSPTSSPSCLTT
jgi:hypothetical protein